MKLCDFLFCFAYRDYVPYKDNFPVMLIDSVFSQKLLLCGICVFQCCDDNVMLSTLIPSYLILDSKVNSLRMQSY